MAQLTSSQTLATATAARQQHAAAGRLIQRAAVEPVFDTKLLIGRKLRALAEQQAGAGFLVEHAAGELADRLSLVERKFDHAAVFFPSTADAVDALRANGQVADIVRIEADARLLADAAGTVAPFETVPLATESIDLAVSPMSMHEMNDLPGFLIQVRRSLKPDGLFLAAMPGAGTLSELRESLLAAETELFGGASPRVFPFTDIRDAGGLLQRAGFALPVADLETLTVRYDSMFALMRDLRGMGATNTLLARSRRPASRRLFLRAAEIYAERFADPDGRIRASFAIVWLSGWAPHASQPKPLEPGSAKVSLKDVLS